MANFKIVTNLDLSGNKLIDVTEITRGDYNEGSPELDLIISAGSNPAGGADVKGGDLKLYSGDNTDGALANGSISLIHPDHTLVLSDTGLAITLTNQPFTLDAGTGTVNIDTGLITIVNDLWVKGNTTLGDGIGNDVTVLGSDFKVVADDLLTETFIVEHSTGNTTSMGTLLLDTTGLTSASDALRIDVDSTQIFKIDGEGTLTLLKDLHILGAIVDFVNLTSMVVGTDNSTSRSAVLHANTTIGSDTNAKTLTVKGNTTFSNISGNAFTTLLTDKVTVNLFDTVATTVNAFGEATIVSIGAVSGLTTINNNFQVIGQTDYLKFNTSYSESGLPEGTLFYSSGDKTISYKTDIADVIVNLGQENVFRARNVSGTTINNGDVVYISGAEATGNTPQVSLARANSASTSGVAGIATSQILSGDYGYITVEGIVKDIDTSTFTEGDNLYLSSSEAGGIVNVAPSIASASAYDIKVGVVLLSDASGSLKVHVENSWDTYSTFNNVKIDSLKIRNIFTLSNTAQTTEASVYWDSTGKLIKYHTGSAIKTIVDVNTSQDLINKTYNALSLTANAVGFTIGGGTTPKSLILVDDVTFNKQFTLNTGNLIINANVANSTITLPEGTLDFSELDPTEPSQRALSISNGVVKTVTGIVTDDSGNMTIDGYLVVNGDFRTTAETFDLLPDIDTTTLNLAQLTPNINIGNSGAVANIINIGNALATSVLNLNSTKDSTAYTNGGVVIAGGVGIAKNLYTNQKVVLSGNSASNPLTLGADVNLYRSAANVLKIDDDVILNNLQSANTTFNFATETTTTLNMLGVTNSVLNIGTAGANTRQVNIFSDVQVGELANQKVLDVFGSVNIGGPTGFGIQYDSVDDSINFVKLV